MITLITLMCKYCTKSFARSLTEHKKQQKRGATTSYCSKKCRGLHRTECASSNLKCAQCNKDIIKTNAERRKARSNNQFCSKSCSARYGNKHKSIGTRRSKMEEHIELKILSEYPQLKMLTNDITTIGYELDFYFPNIRFAIELNGIFHYEPIYGTNKFDRIKFNDSQKMLLCANVGIELCVIDISSCKKFSNHQGDKYYTIIKSILEKIQCRAEP